MTDTTNAAPPEATYVEPPAPPTPDAVTWREPPEAEEMTPEEEAIPAEPQAATEPEPEKPAVESVPVAVHIRQRERYEREMQALRQQQEVGNQRLAQLWQLAQQQTAAAQPPAPDPTNDPLGATLHDLGTLKQQLAETQRLIADREAREQQTTRLSQFTQAVQAEEAQFAAATPDYAEAVNHAKRVKFNEYVALGLQEKDAAARVQADSFALAQHALQSGQNPAEVAYRMAQALGYQKAVKQDPAQVVQMRQAGQARAQATGGGGKTGKITFADLASMPPAEFAKLTSGDNWKKFAGG
jgi:hypothetical protein